MTKAVKHKKMGCHRGRVFLTYLVLCVCFLATSAYLAGRINTYSDNEQSKVIELVNDKVKGNYDKKSDVTTKSKADADKTKAKELGLQISDDTKVWNTDTKVDIFSITYKNGKEIITVNSDDKVIAPGTENRYDFTLKNNGTTLLKYKMSVKAYVTPSEVKLPVYAKLSRSDNHWLLGNKEDYCPVLKLNDITDESKLSVNNYAMYSLFWQWPFEQDNDEYDTLLGNRAVDDDITLTIEIATVAVADNVNDEPNENVKNTTPKTGDDTNLFIYICLMSAMFIVLIILLVVWLKGGRKKEDENSLEEKTEK
jgi:hypothetical protein